MTPKQAHARPGLSISMSGASRWMRCPGSVRLCSTVPKRSTDYSDEGNAAHNLLELCLKGSKLPSAFKNKVDKEYPKFSYTKEMVEWIDVAIDYIWSMTDDAHPEEEVPVKECDQPNKPGRGFVDAWWIKERTLYVFDLKYGAGVRVDAEENEQCMGYAGALIRKHIKLMREAKVNRVAIVICQPRCRGKEPIDVWYTTPQEIVAHMGRVAEASALAQTKDAPVKAGEKQCQFCDAKGVCKAFANAAVDVARVSFADLLQGSAVPMDPKLITPKEMGQILGRLDLLSSWVNAVSNYALQLGLDGKPPPGWYVAEAKAQRRWVDDVIILAQLDTMGAEADVVAPRKLVGLGDMVKILKQELDLSKDEADKFVDDYTERPPGKPTLAPVGDPRPPFMSAATEFADLLDE